MKQIKRLVLLLTLLERLNLSVLALCVSLPFALLYPKDNVTHSLLWAFGVLIPVQLICLICLKVKKRRDQYLLCALVLALALLIPNDGLRRFYYGLSCAPILISGLWMGRPRGKLVLTVPKFYHPLAALMLYSFGKIARNPTMSGFGITLLAVLTLICCFYYSQDKLLQTLRDAYQTEVSRRSIIRINRRLTAVFVLLSILVLIAVPFLFERERQSVPPEIEPAANTEPASTEVTEIEVTMPEIVVPTERGTLLNYDGVGTVMQYLFVAVMGIIVVQIIIGIVQAILSVFGSKGKHSAVEEEPEWVLEKLDSLRTEKPEDPATGWEKKIRRRYEKLILRRTRENEELDALTPTELEQRAGLAGRTGADELHEIYERTRYSPETPDRETYRRAKELAKALEHEPSAPSP